MAAITITTNLPEVLTGLGQSIKEMLNPNYLLRPVAIEVLPMITERIHQKGQASDGSEIGTYSNGYLRTREEAGRGKSTKVIVSLTRQLENNWSVLETTNGYGIGFTNPFNADKLRWVAEAKGKVIAELSSTELDYAFDRVTELVSLAFDKK